MTSLDNHHHAHDGCSVHSSCESEDYYGVDDFTEEGGFQCEDDDVMVEILGSDVYVDGVCGEGNAGDRCFADGVASGCELDSELDVCTESISVESSDRTSKSPCEVRHGVKDTDDRTRKEKSLAELMDNPGEFLEEAPSRKKHRVHDPSISPCTEDVVSIANGISTSSSGMQPSLNIGESTQRSDDHVPCSLESNCERSKNGECALLNGFEIFISESGDVQFPDSDLLEQLQFVSDYPLDVHEETNVLYSAPLESYQFEDTNDSYWTDRVIATNTQDQPYYEYEGEAMIEDSRKLGTLDRLQSTSKESSSIEGDSLVVDDNSPAELILIFPKTGSFPVAATLNKTLKMFGSLKESETQVDRKSNRARVVFRKFRDAKVAFSSAQKYSIFGPLAVKYQLNHPIPDP